MPDLTNDPIILYLIVRSSLNMNPGKIAAQAGHAMQNFIIRYFKIQALSIKLHTDNIWDSENIKITTEWLSAGSRKIVKKANEDEWDAIKKEIGSSCIIIKDAGLTEVEPGSETIMCTWPQHKSKVISKIKKLSLY